MALTRGSIHDRELHKFVESPTRPGEPAIEVSGTFEGSPFAPPANADAFTRSVSGNIETIEFRQGGIAGTVLKTIRVYYQKPPNPNLTGGEIL